MREEIKSLKDRLAVSTETRNWSPAALHRYYLDTTDKSELDKYFSIQQTDEDQ